MLRCEHFFLASQPSDSSVPKTEYCPALVEGICSVRALLKNAGFSPDTCFLWQSLLFSWFSDCSNFCSHFSANSSPLSVPHHFSE